MLSWVFGDVQDSVVHQLTDDTASGKLTFEQANVEWFLSIDYEQIPEAVKAQGKRTFRTLNMEGEEIEFSDGFTELHTNSYRDILNGNGFGVLDTKNAIEMVSKIRSFKG
jgi:UDP-N-acetyl-2-amino-2-deoxyglucuronate dehydrogenase